VVERARALPPESWPRMAEREQDPPQVQLVTNVLTAVLGDLCARWRLASNLVAGSNDLKLLVRSRLQGGALAAESLLTQGWRGTHVLPELLAVLDGRRCLRIADVSAVNPFRFDAIEPTAEQPGP
jgi:ribonuclease D